MNTIRDPRDRRRKMTMITQRNMLGKDTSAWRDHNGEISVYRSQDSPKVERWIHNLNENYLEYMTY